MRQDGSSCGISLTGKRVLGPHELGAADRYLGRAGSEEIKHEVAAVLGKVWRRLSGRFAATYKAAILPVERKGSAVCAGARHWPADGAPFGGTQAAVFAAATVGAWPEEEISLLFRAGE